MIRRREEENQNKVGHERWLVSYADFVTLLFGFFVVMYSVSQVSEQKYRVLSESLSSVFQGNTNQPTDTPAIGEQYPPDKTGAISGLSPQINLVDTQVLANELEDALVTFVQPGHIRISATEDWVQIDLNAALLFDSASAEPKPEAQTIFREIAGKLAPFDNEIEVSGHTDNVPIRTAKFESNWELSSARASSVVRLLADNGVKPAQLSAVGYGEHRPVADNSSDEGKSANRRVVLLVARHPVERHPVERSSVPLNELPTVAPEVMPAEPAPLPTPVQPPVVPVQAPPTENNPKTVEPVRLDDGGLLFSSDPNQRRK